jgi:hypothetical protein
MPGKGDDLAILDFCQSAAIQLISEKGDLNEDNLSVVERSYALGIISPFYRYRHFSSRNDIHLISEELAVEIAENPEKYPDSLVSLAESKCRDVLSSKIVPVGDIAKEQGWFNI